MENKSYVIWNNKGGVGKSTITFHIASVYAEKNPDRDIVVIDMCPQANVSMMLMGGGIKAEKHLQSLISQGTPQTVVGYITDNIINNDVSDLKLRGRQAPSGEGVLAELERSLIKERTRAGRTAAIAKGVKMGRKPILSLQQVAHARELLAQGKPPREVAQLLGVSRATLYRVIPKNPLHHTIV